MSDDMPEQPKTKEIPAAKPEDILLAELRSGFRTVNARLDVQDATLDNVVREGQRTNVRLTRIEERVDEVETRMGRTSSRVKEVSQADLAHDAQLAQERAAREALAQKVDALDAKQDTQLAILTRLDGIAKNPLVKTIAAMLATAFVTWLATHGIKVPQ
jgi:predicted  nucleic acid-binding Zn-ribbon protein